MRELAERGPERGYRSGLLFRRLTPADDADALEQLGRGTAVDDRLSDLGQAFGVAEVGDGETYDPPERSVADCDAASERAGKAKARAASQTP